MLILLSGLAIFFVTHFYSTFRSRKVGHDIKQRLGEPVYMGLYSLVSAIGLGLIIWGYKQAGATEQLYMGLSVDYNLRLLVMLLAFVFLVAANLPTGHIKSILKHPMLIGVSIWSISHLIDGATERQALLFGSFLVYSLIDMVVVSNRPTTTSPTKGKINLKNDIAAFIIGGIAFAVTVNWLHAGLSF